MAQSIGIHIGERQYHLLALDGGLKKHKVVCAASGEILPGEEGLEVLIDDLKAVVKEHKLSADSVYLACDSGLAAFRNLTLPFDDRAKIEEVIKFEIESDLPQFDIDEVVVDYAMLSSKPGVESSLLVTAVPKAPLQLLVHTCERAGLEPLEAEIEGTALFDAAFEAGALAEDRATVLVHVGDTSTTVAVADGMRLVALRAIRAGAYPQRIAAREAPAVEEPLPEGAEGDGLPEASGGMLDPQRMEESARRIRRELTRTLSGARLANEIGAVYLCGHALPGLAGETLEGIAIQPLEVLPEGSEVENPAAFGVAFGTALRGFSGGQLRPRLRREELRFTGKFERVELSLAVCSLLVFTLLFVQFIVLTKKLEWRDEGDIGAAPGDMQLWLEYSNQRVFPDAQNPRQVRLPNPPETIAKYAADAQAGVITDRSKFQQIQYIDVLLQNEIKNLSRELGQATDIKQPQSALEATTLVMETLFGLGEDVRFGIRSYEADFQSRSNKDFVFVTMDIDFYGETSLEATNHYSKMENTFNAQPWCNQFLGRGSKELDDGKGIFVDRLVIEVDLDQVHEEEQQ
jgi:Tfp pilus assembly PilM family ATPase